MVTPPPYSSKRFGDPNGKRSLIDGARLFEEKSFFSRDCGVAKSLQNRTDLSQGAIFVIAFVVSSAWGNCASAIVL